MAGLIAIKALMRNHACGATTGSVPSILYGISSNDALFFVLIVHSIQTLLVILLGIYAWISLSFTDKKMRKI